MEKKVSVDILGHTAWIEDVQGYKANHLRQPEDAIGVMLRFEEAVGYTSSFYILLPVKRYTREEFLGAVHREGKKTLTQIQERERMILEDRALAKKRQDALDQTALEIRSLISLD